MLYLLLDSCLEKKLERKLAERDQGVEDGLVVHWKLLVIGTIDGAAGPAGGDMWDEKAWLEHR
jgi:hypothetical protein